MKTLIAAVLLTVSTLSYAGSYTDMINEQRVCKLWSNAASIEARGDRSGVDRAVRDSEFAAYAMARGKDQQFVDNVQYRKDQVRAIIDSRFSRSSDIDDIKDYVWAQCMDGKLRLTK